MPTVEIVCVGDVDAGVLDFVSAGLAQEFRAEVTRVRTVPVPRETHNAARDQYSSSQILERLAGKPGLPGGECSPGAPVVPVALLLAVTGLDLYVPELNFVFGEAHPAERACIISLARLGTPFEGKPATPEVIKQRALTEAVHEIGHLLGLGHCGTRDCVMFFSNSIPDTDRKGHQFCKSCSRGLLD